MTRKLRAMFMPYPQCPAACREANDALLELDDEVVRRERLTVSKLRLPEWQCAHCGQLNLPWAQECRRCST